MPALPALTWIARAKRHAEELHPFTNARLSRQATSKKHPVHDFLFTYYSLNPAKLLTWHPDPQDSLESTTDLPAHFLRPPYTIRHGQIQRSPHQFTAAVEARVRRVRDLCESISLRPPRHQCFGLHEWAMVYQLQHEQIRHADWPLRLTPSELNDFVRSQPLVCTHYDAFRFFTSEAIPKNHRLLTPEDRLLTDQPGCLHVNMDLYKWCGKLLPWIGSDLLRRTFLLTADARSLDMQASPYDLRSLGYQPIPIETPDGRSTYEKAQRHIAAQALPLRLDLLTACDTILQAYSNSPQHP